jgi:hypothetical protein
MKNDLWEPGREFKVPYEPSQHVLYRAGDPACNFHAVRWPLSEGRAKFGEFPLVVAREHFRKLGYTVLASEPRLPREEGFILVSYPGKRRAGDPAYRRMEAIFGVQVLADLNEEADIAKREATGNRGGGDPDLFAFRPGVPTDRFFVEVKHHDKLIEKQRVTFPFIEQLCPIIVARLVSTAPAKRRRSGKGTRGASW